MRSGRKGGDLGEHVGAVADRPDDEPVTGQIGHDDLVDRRFVVDDEDASRCHDVNVTDAPTSGWRATGSFVNVSHPDRFVARPAPHHGPWHPPELDPPQELRP